jgi:hypothetical protein
MVLLFRKYSLREVAAGMVGLSDKRNGKNQPPSQKSTLWTQIRLEKWSFSKKFIITYSKI